jgi:hypothetical protein
MNRRATRQMIREGNPVGDPRRAGLEKIFAGNRNVVTFADSVR